MARSVWKWIEDRWPVTPVVRAVLVEDIPGGGSYWYTTGSSVLFVFILQAVTGLCELFFYVPTVDHAYVSLSFLRTSVPFGWLIHNLHYWGATAMVVLLLVHMTQNYVWGAYKNPRQLTWIIGVGLFLLTLAMMFTGSPLPWDEKGYWAVEVGTGIAGMTPVVGDLAKRLLQGGGTMGQLTLSRFFILHAALLAGALATLILIHLVAFRRGGSTGPWSERKRLRTGPFWPDQVLMDLVVACVIFVGLVALAAFRPPAYTGLADPTDPMFTPKPEWPFLFLYQSLKLVPGSLEVVVALGLPLVLTVLLLLWPFLDRRPERNPAKRPGAMAVYFVILALIVALSVMGGMSEPGGAGGRTAGPGPATPSPAPRSLTAAERTAAGAGSSLYFKLGCPTCHSINGEGGKVGPDLAGVKARGRSADWLEEQIRNPRSHDLEPKMPAFDRLTPSETESLADFLLGLSGQEGTRSAEALPAGASKAPTGAPLYRRLGCASCHSINGSGGKTGPDLAGEKAKGRSEDWLKDQIRNPGSHNPATVMPAFARLTPAETDALVSYLLGLTGKGPAKQSPAAKAEAAPGSAAAPAAPPRPAPGAARAPGEALAPELIGNARHGGLIFAESCVGCHGEKGRGGVTNPGSADGSVPALAPVDRELFDRDPGIFVSRIDPYLQRGSRPEGPGPARSMPAFGDSRTLTQAQISHLEAYVLDLNGVGREKIERPGLRPAVFFVVVAAAFVSLGLFTAGLGAWRRRQRGRPAAMAP